MFSFEQFDKLHSLWNGIPLNSNICKDCKYLCCNKTNKFLFPNEFAYISKYSNIDISKDKEFCGNGGCICMHSNVKSVICKIYPLRIHEDLSFHIDNYYSSLCEQLIYDNENRLIFLKYLFSDADNTNAYKIFRT